MYESNMFNVIREYLKRKIYSKCSDEQYNYTRYQSINAQSMKAKHVQLFPAQN